MDLDFSQTSNAIPPADRYKEQSDYGDEGSIMPQAGQQPGTSPTSYKPAWLMVTSTPPTKTVCPPQTPGNQP